MLPRPRQVTGQLLTSPNIAPATNKCRWWLLSPSNITLLCSSPLYSTLLCSTLLSLLFRTPYVRSCWSKLPLQIYVYFLKHISLSPCIYCTLLECLIWYCWNTICALDFEWSGTCANHICHTNLVSVDTFQDWFHTCVAGDFCSGREDIKWNLMSLDFRFVAVSLCLLDRRQQRNGRLVAHRTLRQTHLIGGFVLSSSCEEYLCRDEWSSYCQDKSWGPCPVYCRSDQSWCVSYVYDSEGRKPVSSALAEIASEKSCIYHCCSFMFLVSSWTVGIITVLAVSPRSSLHSSGQETPTGQPQCVSLVQTRLPALAMLELNS